MLRAIKPDRVILGGDINDFFQLSRFNTALERIDDLQGEIDSANLFRAAVRKACPDAVIDELEGNHDNRIRSYVGHNARALVSLRALDPGVLFGYKDLGIRAHPGAGFRLRRNLLCKHGTLVRGDAGASAKAEQAQSGLSGVSGHTHRLGVFRKEGYEKREWWEAGCFCRLDPDYIVGPPNWTQGCVVLEVSRRSDAFLVHPVAFHEGKLRLGLRGF